jgi:hypothetical protein
MAIFSTGKRMIYAHTNRKILATDQMQDPRELVVMTVMTCLKWPT